VARSPTGTAIGWLQVGQVSSATLRASRSDGSSSSAVATGTSTVPHRSHLVRIVVLISPSLAQFGAALGVQSHPQVNFSSTVS
jgi:hypothetical protein